MKFKVSDYSKPATDQPDPVEFLWLDQLLELVNKQELKELLIQKREDPKPGEPLYRIILYTDRYDLT